MYDRETTRTSRLLLAAFALVALAPLAAGCVNRAAEKYGGDGTVSTDQAAKYAPAVMPPVADGGAGTAVSGEPGLAREVAPMPGTVPGGSGVDASTIPADEHLIITNKNIRMEIEDVNVTVEAIRGIASKYKATITNLNVSAKTDQPVYNTMAQQKDGSYDSMPLQGWVTVRVPADKYEAFVAEAMKLGKVLRQSEDSSDVTQEHVDLAARLANLRAEEQRLRQFFDKANTVSDMLKVEAELARVRGEIEALDAQMKYLERQAALATVTFELVEPTPAVSPGGEDWGTKSAFTTMIRAFVNTLNGLIIILGPVLAIAIFVALPAYFVIRWIIRLIAKRQAQKAGGGSGQS